MVGLDPKVDLGEDVGKIFAQRGEILSSIEQDTEHLDPSLFTPQEQTLLREAFSQMLRQDEDIRKKIEERKKSLEMVSEQNTHEEKASRGYRPAKNTSVFITGKLEG